MEEVYKFTASNYFGNDSMIEFNIKFGFCEWNELGGGSSRNSDCLFKMPQAGNLSRGQVDKIHLL